MAHAENYNDNQHEEVHQLHNYLHPFVPPSAAKMGPRVILADDAVSTESVDDEEDPKVEVNDSDDGGGNLFSMDSNHDE